MKSKSPRTKYGYFLLPQKIRYFMGKIMPRKLFIFFSFFLKFRRFLNVRNPKTFNEYIASLNYKGTIAKYSHLADKYKVRKFVEERVGSKYLINLIEVFDSVEEIDFDKLPDQFVLKLNTGTGYNIISTDKKELDFEKTKEKLSNWFDLDFYDLGKALIYKKIERKIVCEEYLEDSNGNLLDFKFYCFNGEPKYVQIDIDRFDDHRRCFYDVNWVKQEFTKGPFPLYQKEIQKPENFDNMIKVAKKLSSGFKFVRVDLYNIDGKIYFGEMTFIPAAGLTRFYPPDYDLKLGKMIK
ncbi:MAG: ATP-grasp fold amidoligase family protein [archaeon]